jgi:hypothetical protein
MMGKEGREKGGMDGRTRSRFIVSIALSIPFTTLVMFPVTCRIVMAVSTRLATASMRLARRRRFSDSLFLRIALEAYIRAPSLLPCWSACIEQVRLLSSFSKGMWGRGGREGRRREEGKGDGDVKHVPSSVVLFLNSHLFGPFLLAGSVTLL